MTGRDESERHDLPRSEDEDPRRERRDTLIGGAASIVLTLAAFGVVLSGLGGLGGKAALAGLALLQIAVQLRFFLHIDLQRSHRDDLQLVLFTSLILLLMVGGTIWILMSQAMRMM